MKFKCLILSMLLLSILTSGCNFNYNKKDKTEKINQEVANAAKSQDAPMIINIPKDEIDNSIIAKNYDRVKKEDLDYILEPTIHYLYETKDSFVGSPLLNEIPNIDNKKYKGTLKDFTYACEVNPKRMTYEEALKLAYKVLPDDIKKLREKYDPKTSKTHIVYSSSIGNFVLGLAHPDTNGNEKVNKDIVVGIDYLKEITE